MISHRCPPPARQIIQTSEGKQSNEKERMGAQAELLGNRSRARPCVCDCGGLEQPHIPTKRVKEPKKRKRQARLASKVHFTTGHRTPIGLGPWVWAAWEACSAPQPSPFHHTGCLGHGGGHLTCYRLCLCNALFAHALSHRQSKVYNFSRKLACVLSEWRRLTSLRRFYWKELSPTATTTKTAGRDGVVKYSYQPAGQDPANVSNN